jgi:DNA-binding response OmpR family regulator
MPARIFVVHDEKRITETLVDHLRQDGYDLTGFQDPAAAHDALLASRNVDLLITRVRLGDGRSNGFSLAAAGRARNPALKVLFVALP